ncbi:MAG: GNAT family N-acetyltransferase [Anaerolineae bacterium]|nr:GNAT family N-acetyltransferase [Anaerolineae bacterium]
MSPGRRFLSGLTSRSSGNSLPLLLVEDEHQQIGELLGVAPLCHMHLDWQSLPAMLANPLLRCWVLHHDGAIRALLGATVYNPPAGASVAWLRLALPPIDGSEPGFDCLWEALQDDLASMAVGQIGILAIEPWVENIADDWGFRRTNAVVTLQRNFGRMPPLPVPPMQIRAVAQADLDDIVRVDAVSFHPLWQHDRAALEAAQCQASTFTLIEMEGDILGYQLSTWYVDSGHLARLAVKPEARGQGLSKLLVGDVLHFFAKRNITTITVNTQEDNVVSQRLYASLGFEHTGHSVPVWTFDM